MNHISTDPMSLMRLGSDPSLADLRLAILGDTSLPEARRAALASALNTVGKALRRPLEALPADPCRLRPLLLATTPAMARLSSGSWRNARSLLNAALNHLTGQMLPRRMDLKPSDAWRACLAAMGTGTYKRHHLSRLARYATRSGIEPEAVDDAFMARFEADLTQRSLTAEPARVARDTARAWNEAANCLPDWPKLQLNIPDNRVRYRLAWEDYPASLQAEIERWLDWLGRDVFADRDFRPLRDRSIALRHKQLALYLAAVVETGVDPAFMTSLASVINLAHAKPALQVIYRRGGERLTTHLAHTAGLVLMLAKHWVKTSEAEIDRLRRLTGQLQPENTGLAVRNEARLNQLNDPRRMDAVLTLPVVLSDLVRRAGSPTIPLARLFQTAVAVEIFLMTGLRISNVASLEIGRTLILRADGGIDLFIPRSEVKNNVSITADLTGAPAALICHYIKLYRPLLGEPNSPWLFPGAKPGTHKTSAGLREQVQKAMAELCGVEWHPHLFRHLLARLLLEHDAGADSLVTRALGQKRAESTRYYTGFQTTAAIRKHDELLLRRRATILGPRKGGAK